VPSAGRERDAGCTQLLAGLPRALERPEAGATTAEAFAFKKEIQGPRADGPPDDGGDRMEDTGAS
jgi:hypothetical protein